MRPCPTTKWARRLATWMVALVLCAFFQDPAQPGARILGLPRAQAAEDAKDQEIAALRQRVQALEEQNRQILELLRGLPRPPAAPASTAMVEAPAQGKEAPIRWGDLLPTGSRLKLYGSLRLDSDWDNAPTNDIRLPQWVRSSDRAVRGKDRDSAFALHPRLTRFGLDFQGLKLERLGDGAVSGKLETDFHNGGSESRQIIRIRHAFLKLAWGDLHLLAGQTWDILSPLWPTPNHDTLMWNVGNLGDRRPQFRVGYEPRLGPGRLSLVAGAALSGAIDAKDLDGDGLRDGDDSGRPNLQARFGYAFPLAWARGESFTLGVWGHSGREETGRPVGGKDSFASHSVGIDLSLPLPGQLTLRGEAWTGRNLSDFRGGIGQGINAALRARGIRARGGWGELVFKATDFYTPAIGFSLDDPVDGNLPVQGRTRNQAFWLANRFKLGGNVEAGLDYLHWETDYKDLDEGRDDRFNLFLQYAF